MKILRSISELRKEIQDRDVGFVPTMGAFHEGHLSLMRASSEQFETTVVSLFVNPTQFAANEDLSKYPRDEERDAEMARGTGVDVLFAPSVEAIYPRKSTVVSVSGVSERWEGEIRPGHFDGVATVVLKLFNIVQPRCAFFGLKDLQQCAIVKRMVDDLNLPIELRFEPTVRESDGLAMSSRNAYLNTEERRRAALLFAQLAACAERFRKGDCDVRAIELALASSAKRLEDGGLRPDYFELVDTDTLEPTRKVGSGTSIIAAVRVGKTRLIDNVQI